MSELEKVLVSRGLWTHRILVRHVCQPGVWNRAPLITPDGDAATATQMDPRIAWVDDGRSWTTAEITDDWHVCLDDRMGLGLAGLASTVAERLGPDTQRLLKNEGLRATAAVLEAAPWFPLPTHKENVEISTQWGSLSVDSVPYLTDVTQVYCVVSTFLRLTDDLCDALGWEREGHEVARWGRTQVGKLGRWRLLLGEKHWDFYNSTDDWLPALEEALKAAKTVKEVRA